MAWNDFAEPTPNWDDLGWGGIPREGEGSRIAKIAEIAKVIIEARRPAVERK
jgi:hypothetical protein